MRDVQFIKSILTNLGPQTLDQIQRMLGFADGYDQSQDELEVYLAAARKEGMVNQKGDGRWVLLDG